MRRAQVLIIICISGNVSLGERITVLGADDDRTVNYITSCKWSPFVAQLPVPAAPCSWLQDYIKGFLLVREPQRELFPSPPQDYLTITLDKTSKGLFACVRTTSTILSSSMSAPLKHLPTEGYGEVGGLFPAQDSAAHAPRPGMEGGLLRLCQGKTDPGEVGAAGYHLLPYQTLTWAEQGQWKPTLHPKKVPQASVSWWSTCTITAKQLKLQHVVDILLFLLQTRDGQAFPISPDLVQTI